MVAAPTVFHGTEVEKLALVAAVARHCTCEHDTEGKVTTACGPHTMLVESQATLDHLIFARRVWAKRRADGVA
jgi:hypothetical protein